MKCDNCNVTEEQPADGNMPQGWIHMEQGNTMKNVCSNKCGLEYMAKHPVSL